MTRALSLFLLVAATPVLADGHADAAAIRAAIIGNTVEGGMSDGAAYAEFYAADGAIKGKDYAGTWTIEGDRMCFAYGEAPTCYGVRIAGDKVTWMSDTAEAGTGTIRAGNPNGF
jgi:hypothetical protein